MSVHQYMAAAVLAIGALVGAFLWRGPPVLSEDRLVIVRVEGPKNARVTIIIDADGETMTYERWVPCDILTEVRSHYGLSVNRLDGPEGTFQVDVEVDGETQWRNSSPTGVIGRVEFNGTKIKLGSMTGL